MHAEAAEAQVSEEYWRSPAAVLLDNIVGYADDSYATARLLGAACRALQSRDRSAVALTSEDIARQAISQADDQAGASQLELRAESRAG